MSRTFTQFYDIAFLGLLRIDVVVAPGGCGTNRGTWPLWPLRFFRPLADNHMVATALWSPAEHHHGPAEEPLGSASLPAEQGILIRSPAGSEMDHWNLVKPPQVSKTAHIRQRRFPRWRLDARIQVSVFRDGVTTLLWGRTNELGADGIGATLTGELTTGEVVSMEFPVPVAPFNMTVRAIVRYSQGLRCGFEFLVVTSEQRETLRRTCELLANS